MAHRRSIGYFLKSVWPGQKLDSGLSPSYGMVIRYAWNFSS